MGDGLTLTGTASSTSTTRMAASLSTSTCHTLLAGSSWKSKAFSTNSTTLGLASQFMGGAGTSRQRLQTIDSPAFSELHPRSSFVLRPLLTPQQKEVLQRIQTLLARVPADLSGLHISKQEVDLLRDASQSLEELFLIVVVGEFNSGKSNFINALLGDNYCPVGILPTTENIQILRYQGKSPQEGKVDADGRSVSTQLFPYVSSQSMPSTQTFIRYLPVPWLSQANLVDTPGTNAVIREHEQLTEKFVPAADMILFVTSVERPFTESEKQFLAKISEWGKKVVIALNKADLVAPSMAWSTQAGNIDDAVDQESSTKHNLESVVDFVKSNAKNVLGHSPLVFPVSARTALRAKLALKALVDGGNTSNATKNPVPEPIANEMFERSGFADLEDYILNELTDDNKIKLKMETPLNIVDKLIRNYAQQLEARASIVWGDIETREMIQSSITEFQAELKSDFKQHLHKLENIFLRMKQASDHFMDNEVHIKNIPSLALKRNALKASYESQVCAHVNTQIDEVIHSMATWIVTRTARHAQSLAAIMQRSLGSPAAVATPLTSSTSSKVPMNVGISPDGSLNVAQQAERLRAAGVDFQQDRSQLRVDLQARCRELFDHVHREKEVARMVSAVQSSVFMTAAVELSAVGVGALVASAMLDTTGIAGAGALALTGLFIIPAQRVRAKKEMNAKIDEWHKAVEAAITAQFERELLAATSLVSDAVAPFLSWVDYESLKVRGLQHAVESIESEINALRRSIATFHNGKLSTSTNVPELPSNPKNDDSPTNSQPATPTTSAP